MKMRKLFMTLLLVPVIWTNGQEKQTTIKNEAFSAGEVLIFRLHYGFINAGTAQLEVNSATDSTTGRACFRVTGTAKSAKSFDWIFKVRDSYESVIDAVTFLPYQFNRKIEEGKYRKEEHIRFNQQKHVAIKDSTEYQVPPEVHDIISFFYYVRTINFGTATTGQVFPIMGFLDNKVIPLHVKFLGREIIKSELGKISCIVLEPQLQEGKVLKERENMRVWLSDDKNKVPVRVEASILVGSLNMDLTGTKNLNSPLLVSK